MLKGNAVLGMPVLSRQDGQKIGSTRDIVIAKDHSRIVAFILDEGGLFAAATAVGMENVVSFGKDALIITDSKAVVRVDHFPEVKAIMDDRDGLVGKHVFTESGDLKGKVEDIYFDETTGNIVGLEVEGKFTAKHSNASVQLRPADIVSIGPDAVVINMASVPELEAQGAGGPRPLDAPVATTADDPSPVSTNAPMPTLADLPATSDTQATGDSTGEYARLSGTAPGDQVAESRTSFDASAPATSSDATVQLPTEPDQGRNN
jgi:uncharacterized protein YrrD